MTPRKKKGGGEPAPAAAPAGSVMPAGEFKTHCLRVMEEVAEYHLDVLITKHGRPVARLVPVEDEIPDSFGGLRGTVAYGDADLTAPDFEAWNGADS